MKYVLFQLLSFFLSFFWPLNKAVRYIEKLDVVCISLQRTIYIPQPTWGNHTKVFTLSGLSVKTYRYYDPATRGLNFQGEVYNLFVSRSYCDSMWSSTRMIVVHNLINF